MIYKKALVTGSSGFLGSHIVDALYDNDIEPILFDSKESMYKKSFYNEYIGDILDFSDIKNAAKDCDVIFHFAAQADISKSTELPVQTIKANILGTQNVLEVARELKISRLIFASTVYVYSELGSFYRVSKQSCEKIIEEYKRQFNIDYTILRYGSLYGPRANEFNAINDFLIQALKNNKIIRKGNGEELREYIHVKDAALSTVEALGSKFKNKYLIIAGNQPIKIKDLLTMIKEIFENNIEVKYVDETEADHYQITPYNYKPQIAEKLSSGLTYDLGQGLLEQIYLLDKEKNKNKENTISLRKK